jgi:hypothetical protein
MSTREKGKEGAGSDVMGMPEVCTKFPTKFSTKELWGVGQMAGDLFGGEGR